VSLPEVKAPAKVVNLMDALKRSLAETPTSTPAKSGAASRKRGGTQQPHLLLPVKGGKEHAPARRKAAGKARKQA
jgi:hypothetical protein